MQEIWRDVVGYEGLYKVSNRGRVKSLNYEGLGKEEFLKLSPDKHGYMRVYLYKDKKRKTCQVHRLVAEAFIPNPNKLPDVNHKNENPRINDISNLEWCTEKYNCNYGNRNKKISKAVLQYDANYNLIREWNSIIEASKELKITDSNISRCCRDLRKTAGKYIWKYKD